jgi:hypothetical protein
VLIYLDSSAIVKLIRRDPETRALFDFLRAWPERVSSVLSSVEVPRAVRRTSRRLAHDAARRIRVVSPGTGRARCADCVSVPPYSNLMD